MKQLEFDLLVPDYGASEAEKNLLREAAGGLQLSQQKINWARMVRDVARVESLIAPGPQNELAELKVLLGAEVFKKARRRWERRLKQDPIAVRRAIAILRVLFENL